MPGRRHLPGAHEAIGSGEPTSRHGLLTWWQRRSRRTDLAVLARVRDGLRRLDAEPDGEDHASLMTFHVRAVPGGWVSNARVHYAEPGTELILGPALGTMNLSLAGQRDLLFVAGGTGLSPVKGIIEQALRESSACPRQIFLFYGARTRDGLYHLPELYRLADAYPRFQITPVTSDDPVFDGIRGTSAGSRPLPAASRL